jgi:GxxExxY protein
MLLFYKETYLIVGACLKVHSTLGPGFLESVYQEALEIEFSKQKIEFNRQKKLPVYFNNQKLKKYFVADFVCYNQIIVEIKVIPFISKQAEFQLINYLKATNFELGLLVNFGTSSLTWKRFINTPPRNPLKSV